MVLNVSGEDIEWNINHEKKRFFLWGTIVLYVASASMRSLLRSFI